MKKKIGGFSLIELIIVISVIAIIGVSGLSYFTHFIDDLRMNNSIYEIKGDLESLDNKINKKEIFDYELYFKKDNLYYLISKNIFDINTSLKLDSLDLNSGIGNISFSGASYGTGTIRYYSNYKFQKEEIIDYNGNFIGNFLEYQNYRINGSFSGKILNELNLNFFDKDKFIKLVGINTKEDNNGVDYNNVVIKNILGKKEFYDNSLNKINTEKIYLFFENNIGKIENLEISK